MGCLANSDLPREMICQNNMTRPSMTKKPPIHKATIAQKSIQPDLVGRPLL